MRGILFFLLTALSAGTSVAQNVGIGTSTPNASAMLEINSNNKGLLLPRIADTGTVSNPAKGLMIYSNSNNKLWYYDGNRWQQAVANAGGMDSIWYKAEDSVAYTAKEYVGVNTDFKLAPPKANFQITGSLLVQPKLDYSTTPPTAGQILAMANSSSMQFIPSEDSVLRLYDPSGTGSYGSNMQGNVSLGFAAQVGMKVSSVADHFGFGTGDTLWISEFPYPLCRSSYTRRFTNTIANPADFILRPSETYFSFRSNADGSNGKGFNFLITRLYGNAPFSTIQPIGSALCYNPNANAFSAGLNARAYVNAVALGNDANSFTGSFAGGVGASATGGSSLALGYVAKADEEYATAIGPYATAAAPYSTAIGRSAIASGDYSVAIGNENEASGDNATAMGQYSDATGSISTALGSSLASGLVSTSMGTSEATGSFSTAMGRTTIARGFASVAMGMFNDPIMFAPATTSTPGGVLFTLGNGNSLSDRSNAIVVLKNGNTGIGTNFPDERLNVEGNITMNNASGTTLQLQAASVQKGFMQLSGDNLRIGTYSTNDQGNVIFRLNGFDRMTILPNGNATLTGTLTQNSDARFKTGIHRIDHALEKVLQLNGYRYQWKPELKRDNSMQVGLIAQNVESVLPELVSIDKDGNKSVAYQNVVAVLIEAVKEQQQQINDLKLQVAALRKR